MEERKMRPRPRRSRRKVCKFCVDKATSIDYKDVRTLEKFVTERAYMHPKFVEDTVRDLALAMRAEPRVLWYRVSVASHESIHNHDAFAVIVGDKRNG